MVWSLIVKPVFLKILTKSYPSNSNFQLLLPASSSKTLASLTLNNKTLSLQKNWAPKVGVTH